MSRRRQLPCNLTGYQLTDSSLSEVVHNCSVQKPVHKRSARNIYGFSDTAA